MRVTNITVLSIVLFWLLISLFSLGQDYLYSRVREEVFYFWEDLSFKIGWLLYVPVTLAVFWLGTLLPIKRRAVTKALIAHTLSSLLLGVLYTIGFAGVLSFFWNRFIYPVSFAQMWEKALATNLLYSVLMYWLILGGFVAFSAYGQLEQLQLDREKAQKLLLSTRLNALKMQLQPHFLFNVHHTIIGLMQQGDLKRATAMLLKVSDLLRISLREQVADLVPLSTELTLLQLYLDIQQIRLGERLHVEWSIPPDLKQALVPPMLLQPIVENTFKHGIEPYSKVGIIHLAVNRSGNNLQIAVQDNGIEDGRATAFSLGTGLTNTLERLEHLFADAFVFSIDKNPDCPGITVRIGIPLLFPASVTPTP